MRIVTFSPLLQPRSFLTALRAAIVLTSVISAVVPGSAATTGDSRTITSGCEIDYPPFCMVDSLGRADGFSVELMRAALAAMGRDVSFRTGTWPQVRGWLEQGDINTLPLVGRTPEREKLFDFTFPYMSLFGAIVVRDDNRDIAGLRDLRGKRVAVMKGDNAEEFLRREPRGINLTTTPSFADALRILSLGECDAVVVQRLVALRLIPETGFKNIRLLNQPISEFRQDFCFAVHEGDREMLALLNEGLALVMADGTYQRLHAKWFAALELPSNRRLIVGGDHNYPPWEYLDESGHPQGFNVDLMQAVAREIGIEIQFRLGSWTDALNGLRDGSIDIIAGMFFSSERSKQFDFTPPYAVNNCVAVVRKSDGPAPRSVEQLRGKRIIVQQNDFMHDFALQHGLGDSLIIRSTQEEVLRELVQGSGDIALTARVLAMHLIKKHNWNELRIGSHAFLSPEYCMAVRKGQKALLAQLTEGLRTVEESGQYRRLYSRWVGTEPATPVNLLSALRYSAMIIVPLVIALLVFFAWSWSLRRQVARRTSQLAAVSQRYQATLAAIPDIVAEINAGDIFTWTNEAGRSFFGIDIVGHATSEFTVDSQKSETITQQLSRRNESVTNIEIFQRRSDGQTRLLSWWWRVLKDRSGTVTGALATARDITDRTRAETALQQSLELQRAIVECSPLAVFSMTPDGTVVTWNASAERMLGWSAVEVIGKSLPIVPDDNADDFRTLRTKILAGDMFTGQKRSAHTKSGQRIHINLSAGPIFGEHGTITGIIATIEDITEHVALEEQFRQSQKMESIGRLAGGVAHDYNNILNVIIGHAQLGLRRCGPTDQVRSNFSEIIIAAKRSADITKQLLAFARKQTINPSVLDLNRTIESMLSMLRRLIGEDINLAWLPYASLWPVKMDPTQIDQILANLCVNARDAISGVGNITIETGNVSFDRAYCEEHSEVRPGDYVLLTVGDNGCGMDQHTLDNVFEPFFTTKETGKGTGLGLATVYGIVKQNEGFINVSSEPDKGTTFKMYLPARKSEIVATPDETPSVLVQGNAETVLLVEDEDALRDMTKGMLEELGYTVLSAGKPTDALALAKNVSHIHLILTDVVMPEMNGRVLAQKLQAMHPDTRVLYMSGYTADVIAHRGVLDEGLLFIAKPFSFEQLSEKVYAAIRVV